MTFLFRFLKAFRGLSLLAVLLAVPSLTATAQRVDWLRKLSDQHAPTDGVGNRLAVDRDGNSYLAGYFSGSLTIGAFTINTTAGFEEQVFIVKLDSANTPIWLTQSSGRTLTPNGYANSLALALDTLGNLFLSGYSVGEFHLDAFTLTRDGSFVANLDAQTGNCRWLRQINNQLGNSGGSRLGIIQLVPDNSGDCLLIGHANLTDSIGNLPLIKRNTYDPFIARMTAGGQFQWVRQLKGQHIRPPAYYDRVILDAATDGAGNLVIAGSFADTLIVAPGQSLIGDTANINGFTGFTDAFVAKYDRQGNLVWAKQGHDRGAQAAYHVAIDTQGSIVAGLASYFNGNAMTLDGHIVAGPTGIMKFSGSGSYQWTIDRYNDWDIGPLCTDASDNIYVTSTGMTVNCFAPNGTVRWATLYPPRESWKFYAVTMKIDAARNLYIYGGADSVVTINGFRLEGNYFDVLGRVSPRLNQLTGKVFLDADGDGVLDAGETGFGRTVPVFAGPGTTYEPRNGNSFVLQTGLGPYDVRLQRTPVHYRLTTPPGGHYQGTFTGYGSTVGGLNFGLAPIPGQPDLRVTLTPYTPARRGLPVRYGVQVENIGTVTLRQIPVSVTLDSRVQFISGQPAPTVAGQTFGWLVPSLAPFESRHFTLSFSVPLSVALGDTLVSRVLQAVFDPQGQISRFDTLWVPQIIRGSFDPNDLTVNYTSLTPAQVAAGTLLDYTIRFQNMGNDTAFAVVLHDSLPANLLDLNTLELVGQSHNCRWALDAQGHLTVRFINIALPHQGVDVVRSMGYVRFQVAPNSALVPGSLIPNTAHITFDYNAAVATNQVTTFVQIPNGLVAATSATALSIYPNPATERTLLTADLPTAGTVQVRLTDALGREVRRTSATAPAGAWQHPVSTNGLTPGVYGVQLTLPDGATVSRRLVVQ